MLEYHQVTLCQVLEIQWEIDATLTIMELWSNREDRHCTQTVHNHHLEYVLQGDLTTL